MNMLPNVNSQALNMLNLAETMLSAANKGTIIQGFITNSHKKDSTGKIVEMLWDHIKSHDEVFFIDNAHSIFAGLPVNQVNIFRDIFLTKNSQGEPVISKSLRDQIWGILEPMVKIAIKYIHRDRQPYSVEVKGTLVRRYHAAFFDDINLVHHAAVWKMDLPFPPRP
jgi:hypothetical protein